jgi:NAD(P)-dependent dehydrogenase (short-subunit alcohol dehydrogenase family)
MRLDEQVGLVTGASRGVNVTLAEQAAKQQDDATIVATTFDHH